MNILVVEDERPLAIAISRILREAGHSVVWTDDGDKGLRLGRDPQFDLAILDVLLPGKSGWDILSGLRGAKVNIPILMLTALDEVQDKVKGLDLGADDYLAKPFDMLELIARVNALLRRDKANKGQDIQIADLCLNRKERKVFRQGKVIALTRREYDLLEALAMNQGRVLSRETIQEKVWGDEDSVSNVVDAFIASLRRKIDTPFEQKLIHTVVGFGYVLKTELNGEGDSQAPKGRKVIAKGSAPEPETEVAQEP